VDVKLTVDRRRGAGILRWKPSPAGRKPLRYRIYGSDERGFSVSDTPYTITAGVSRDVPATQPANFVTETTATHAAVIGPELRLPNANRAYYRVVAVDEHGKQSGLSDLVAAPRPLIYSRPVTTARVGSPYRCTLATLRSLGDLRMRVIDGRETMSFWEIEASRFALRRGPSWLALDPVTGVLSGIPDRPGEFPVVVTATLEREIRNLDVQALSWGIEKVLSTDTQRVGVATRTFTIAVSP
jgi:hypothetical protein